MVMLQHTDRMELYQLSFAAYACSNWINASKFQCDQSLRSSDSDDSSARSWRMLDI
jgi:hypothetical protein